MVNFDVIYYKHSYFYKENIILRYLDNVLNLRFYKKYLNSNDIGLDRGKY